MENNEHVPTVKKMDHFSTYFDITVTDRLNDFQTQIIDCEHTLRHFHAQQKVKL